MSGPSRLLAAVRSPASPAASRLGPSNRPRASPSRPGWPPSGVSGCAAFPPPAQVRATTPNADAESRQLIDAAQDAALQGDHATARDAFAKAATLVPGNARVAYYLGREHESLNDHPSAVREYCRYLALSPSASRRRRSARAHRAPHAGHRDRPGGRGPRQLPVRRRPPAAPAVPRRRLGVRVGRAPGAGGAGAVLQSRPLARRARGSHRGDAGLRALSRAVAAGARPGAGARVDGATPRSRLRAGAGARRRVALSRDGADVDGASGARRPRARRRGGSGGGGARARRTSW